MAQVSKIFDGKEFFLYEAGLSHHLAKIRSAQMRRVHVDVNLKQVGTRISRYEGKWAVWLSTRAIPRSFYIRSTVGSR